MSTAVIIYDGRVYKTNQFLSFELDVSGWLSSFEVMEENEVVKYVYFSKSYFKAKDNAKSTDAGYYNKSKFIEYLIGTEVNYFELVSKFRYTDFIPATQGVDIVEFKKLTPLPPFVEPFTYINYEFTLPNISPLYYKKLSQIPKVIESNSGPNFNILTPVHYFQPNGIHSTNNYIYHFYQKNFGQFITAWDIPETNEYDDNIFFNPNSVISPSKKSFANLMNLICYRVIGVVRDIIDKIAVESLIEIKDRYLVEKNNPNQSNLYHSLTDVDKMIASLLDAWGIIYEHSNFTVDFQAIFPSSPSFDSLWNYYNGLKALQGSEIAYKQEDVVFGSWNNSNPNAAGFNSDYRLSFLTNSLHISALSIIPQQSRFEILKLHAGVKNLSYSPLDSPSIYSNSISEIILKIIESFNNELDANYLLNELIKIEDDSSVSLFKILYLNLSDARLERIFLVSILVDKKTYKKTFIFLMYELWKKSNFDPKYVPTTVNPNNFNLNPNLYWLTPEGINYFGKFDSNGEILEFNLPVLDFDPKYTVNNYDPATSISIRTLNHYSHIPSIDIEDEKIEITSQITETSTTTYYVEDPYFGDSSISFFSGEVLLQKETSKYHLYQPITLLGYRSDFELQMRIPPNCTVPAFLFHYAKEFDRLKDFDAAISFGVEVAFEVGLFFLFGGANSLRSLSYLRYLTTAGRTTASVATATNTAIIWNGVYGAIETLTMGTALISSQYQFLLTTADDPANRQKYQKQRDFFALLTIGFGLSSAVTSISKRYLQKVAKELVNEIDFNLANSISYSINSELETIARTIAASSDVVAVDVFRSTNLINHSDLLSKFDNLSNVKKAEFYDDFKFRDNNDYINLNLNNGAAVTRWELLYDLKLPERVLINDVLNVTKHPNLSNYYTRYFNNIELEEVLRNLTPEQRILVLKNYGDVTPITFNNLVNQPTKLEIAAVGVGNLNKQGLDPNSFLTKDEVLSVFNSNLSDDVLSFTLKRIENLPNKAAKAAKFVDVCDPGTIDNILLENLWQGSFKTELKNAIISQQNGLNLTAKQIKALNKANIFITEIKPIIGGIEQAPIYEGYISGIIEHNNILLEKMRFLFPNGAPPSIPVNINGNSIMVNLKTVDNFSDYSVFSNKMIDLNGVNRFNDTEPKFLYNFIDTHFQTVAESYNIRTWSTLKTCGSCEINLTLLDEFLTANNKTSSINVFHSPFEDGKQLKGHLNP